MSTQHVRPPLASMVVLAVSGILYRHGRNQGRLCQLCNSLWTIDFDANEDPHVWRNGTQTDSAVLDWTGNNAVVECSQHEAAGEQRHAKSSAAPGRRGM